MNDDEFQALQEENEQKAELAAAIEVATAASLDADKIMAEAREGYKSLQKLNFLNQIGIYSERDGMIRALKSCGEESQGWFSLSWAH